MTSLGYIKHGKSYFFGDLTSYIDSSSEPFVIAPGKSSVKSLIIELVEKHLEELEKKGLLPKGKG